MVSEDRAVWWYAVYYTAWPSLGVVLSVFLRQQFGLALLPAVATAVGFFLHVLLRRAISYPGIAALLSAILAALIIPLGIGTWYSVFAFFTAPPGLVLGSYLLVAGLERPSSGMTGKSLENAFLISTFGLLPIALLASGPKGYEEDHLRSALLMLYALVMIMWGTKYWIHRRAERAAPLRSGKA